MFAYLTPECDSAERPKDGMLIEDVFEERECNERHQRCAG